MRRWFDAIGKQGLERGVSFDLDFHTIPDHGDDALVEKHYVSKRSRRQKGVLAFVAQDADVRVFCYANGQIRKDQQRDEILRFVDFWKQRTGRLLEELVFDSQLTTYANLHRLNQLGIAFITLRRRSPKMLHAIHQAPLSAWRRIELENVTASSAPLGSSTRRSRSRAMRVRCDSSPSPTSGTSNPPSCSPISSAARPRS